MHMLYEGGLLAVVVVFFFLRDWRATLIAAAALPLSILPAFMAMSWLGYSLNVITLLALAVVVGILVDDAIVEIENIERHSPDGHACCAGGLRRSGRDCAGSHRDHHEPCRRLPTNNAHERRTGALLQTVRLDRDYRRARVIPCRAPAYTADGRPVAAAPARKGTKASGASCTGTCRPCGGASVIERPRWPPPLSSS